MKPILTPRQMKKADETAITRLRIPSLRLMERAGQAVAECIVSIAGHSKRSRNNSTPRRVLILCGKGNNGGDGFVIARVLSGLGCIVTTALIEHPRTLSGDAQVQFQHLIGSTEHGSVIRFGKEITSKRKSHYDVIVDAMLGTSFHGALRGTYLAAVKWCNGQNGVKISVDIPTGLNGETGEVTTEAFRADRTVTFSNPKTGFYFGRAKEFTGDVLIADIGIPRNAVPKTSAQLTELKDIQKTFPKRAVNSHKHSVGKVFVIAGSRSMMGAALLCSHSAMRSGAGQVILGIPESEYLVAAKRTLEVMPLPLPATTEGSISLNALTEINKRIAWSDVVLIGCGLSLNKDTQELIRIIIRTCTKPMVIDADGLNALAGHLDLLKNPKRRNIVLTPHTGEFSRLIGQTAAEIEKNRFSLASKFAQENGVTLVLKGAPSIVADPKGTVTVNPTGNPGMSTAGSGDVLAGIIAALIGQGNTSDHAAINGVYVHGEAGDLAAEKIGQQGMIARDLIKFTPKAIRKVLQS